MAGEELDIHELQIVVKRDVELSAATLPKRVAEALRRQLRQYEFTHPEAWNETDRHLFNLLESREGRLRLPQTMLASVTDACRRHGVEFSVIDRRAMVSCQALRFQQTLSKHQSDGLRRLLLKDTGVLVAENDQDRDAVAAELIARRKQRTLLLTSKGTTAEQLSRLRKSFAVEAPIVAPLSRCTDVTRIAVASYEAMSRRLLKEPVTGFGLVLFDGVDDIDPITLMRAIRGVDARYTVGLARSQVRDDELHGPLYLALGGVAATIAAPAGSAQGVRLHVRAHTTAFHFEYGGRQQYQAVLAALATDPTRADLVADEVLTTCQQGQRCFVISDRRDHLETLVGRLKSKLGRKLEALTSDVRPADRAAVLDRFQSGEIRVLFCTSQLALEALNSASADALFIGFPFSYGRKLEDLLGALLQPADGKRGATVIDYNDVTIPPLQRAFEKRAKIIRRVQKRVEQAIADQAQLNLI